jgi:hypothetical protein
MKCAFRRLILSCALALASTLQAEESGTGHYQPGATASFIDALPDKPGWIVESLYMNYSGTYGFFGGIPYGDSIALDARANANAESLLLMYTPPFEFLGGHPSFAVAVPYVWENVRARATIDSQGVAHRGGRSDSANGMGDIEFWPLMLGWAKGDLKWDVRCGIYAPSGAYDKNRLANPGLGYWTFEPEVTLSWMTPKSPWSSKIGTEVSLFAGLDFNTRNPGADYLSGDIFHLDCTVAQHLALLGGYAGLGANGFFYQQFTGDSGSGARLGSFKAGSYGVGPEVSYVHPIGKTELVVEVKWLPQLNAENTTKGDYIWVKLALLF